MKILVTGGCGFIGSNLIPMLRKGGHTVRVLDNLSAGSPEVLDDQEIDLLVGDIRNQKIIQEAVSGMDAVIHLAAHTNVIDSISNPEFDFEVNARGTFNLLLASREENIKKFVLASSNAPIGKTDPPIDESKAPKPMSPYGASKLAGEGYCSVFYHSYGINTVVLRFANVYGPYSYHKGSVVAKFIKEIVKNYEITIYGDGDQTRDFVYVEDLCRAIMEGLNVECGGETFQIATGKETSVGELVNCLKELMKDTKFKINYVPQRNGEIIKNYSNISKANQVLNWNPEVELKEGLLKTIDWFLHQSFFS